MDRRNIRKGEAIGQGRHDEGKRLGGIISTRTTIFMHDPFRLLACPVAI